MAGLGPGEWIFIALVPFCILVEHLAPRVPGQRLFSVGSGRKILYLLLRAGVGMLSAGVLAWLMRVYPPRVGLAAAGVPLAAQCVVVFLLIDFKQYWLHRGQHASGWWWRFHKVHHATTEISWHATGPTHLLEAFSLQNLTAVLITWGVGAESAAFVLGSSIASTMIGGILAHVNVDFPRGPLPWWARVVNTPNLHAHHHARRVESANFGEVLMIWDLLFGTFEVPAEVPRVFGLPDEPGFPTGIVAQQLSPLRPGPAPTLAAGPAAR